jgi:hypothetical protein
MSSISYTQPQREDHERFLVRLRQNGPSEFHGRLNGQKLVISKKHLYIMNVGLYDQVNKYDQFEIVGTANDNANAIDLTEQGVLGKPEGYVNNKRKELNVTINDARQREKAIKRAEVSDNSEVAARDVEIEAMRKRLELIELQNKELKNDKQLLEANLRNLKSENKNHNKKNNGNNGKGSKPNNGKPPSNNDSQDDGN